MKTEDVAPAKARAEQAEALAKIAVACGHFLTALEDDGCDVVIGVGTEDATRSRHLSFPIGPGAESLKRWFVEELAGLVRQLRQRAAVELVELKP